MRRHQGRHVATLNGIDARNHHLETFATSPPATAVYQLAWRLLGSKNTIVECTIRQTVSLLYVVTVASGSETFVDEVYPDLSSAMSRALQVRDRLLNTGDWANISAYAVSDLSTNR